MSKDHPKSGQKFFQREFFFVSCRESFFGQGSEEMSKEHACKVSRQCHFCTWSFFRKKVTQRRWTDILLPRSISLLISRPPWNYLLLLCIYGMPTRFDGEFSCSQRKKLATCQSRLCRLGVAPCTIGMSTSISAGNPCFLRQSSCDVISRNLFLCDSSFFSVERINEKKSVSFKTKSNFNPFSSHTWKMSLFEELVPMKKVRQIFCFW